MRRVVFGACVALAMLGAGCNGAAQPKDGDGDGKGGGGEPAVPAVELQARIQQWGDVLEEEHPLSFPGDAESLAWEQRKREATAGLLDAGAQAVSTLHRLRDSKQRIAAVLSVAILAEIKGPEALKELRDVVDNTEDKTVENTEVLVLAIEGLGHLGGADDHARLRRFLSGGKPLNTIVNGGPRKRRAERDSVLQNAAAESLALLGVYDGMPALLGNLGGGGWARRDAAIRMQRLTGKRFGFALDAPRPQREQSIASALEWWKSVKDTWKPEQLPPRKAHDIYVRVAG